MRTNAPGQGRKKTPTETLRKRKSQNLKNRVDEPQPEPGRPRMPNGMEGEARSKWKEIVTLLDKAGMLTKNDGATLARYCRLYAEWVAITSYEPERLAVETVDDLRVIHRHLDKMLKVNDSMLRIEVQYGMTPASRPNVKKLEKPAHGNASKDKARFFQSLSA